MAAKEKINLLDIIPLRSTHVTTEWEGDYAIITFPRYKYEWMKRILVSTGKSTHVKLQLGEHGTAVWQLIDGKTSVSTIINSLANHFENEENYASRIVNYIYQLQKDGFIIYLLPDQP